MKRWMSLIKKNYNLQLPTHIAIYMDKVWLQTWL